MIRSIPSGDFEFSACDFALQTFESDGSDDNTDLNPVITKVDPLKLAHFEDDNIRYAGLLDGAVIRPIGPIDSLHTALGHGMHGMRGLIAHWNPQLLNAMIDGSDPVDLANVQLLAPLPDPEKIICIGRNYAEHAAEMGAVVKELPVIFNKFPSSIAHPGSTIPLPVISECVDYEAELVVVIGREGADISQDKAMDYVFGYCCGNDVSARDWQKGKPGGQWLLGKTFDSFAPIGPWIVTRDEVDINDLEISLTLNGQTMQRDKTSNLIFGIDYLIAHLSKFVTLRPGDLLFTGTPAGVGAGKKPPEFLNPGDETVVEITGLGQLRNTFSAV